MVVFDGRFNTNKRFVYYCLIDTKNTEILPFYANRNGYFLGKQPLNYPPEMTKTNLCLRHFTHCLKINTLREYRLKFMQGHKH